MRHNVNRVIAFIDTGGSVPDPWGHHKHEKREVALSVLDQHLQIDAFNEWSMKLLQNPHYQAAITLRLYNKCPDWRGKKFVSAFAHGFLDLQLTRRCISYTYLGKVPDK